jgi:hypothetical protein
MDRAAFWATFFTKSGGHPARQQKVWEWDRICANSIEGISKIGDFKLWRFSNFETARMYAFWSCPLHDSLYQGDQIGRNGIRPMDDFFLWTSTFKSTEVARILSYFFHG